MKEQRKEINEIDLEIIKLLVRRFNLGKEIAEFKFENQLPIFDQNRENELFDYYDGLIKSENKEEIILVLKNIIKESKNIQQKYIDSKK